MSGIFLPMLILFPLEEHLEVKGFFKGGFLHLDSILRKKSGKTPDHLLLYCDFFFFFNFMNKHFSFQTTAK
jgi:hypothetical protein